MSLPSEPSEASLSNQQSGSPALESDHSTPQAARSSKKRFAGGILAPLGVRDFRLLFSGQMISTLGDSFYAVALPWLVLTTSGNAQELGIVLAAYGVPRVGSVLLGGVLSDRLRPRRVMLLADIVRALLVGMLALLAISGHPVLWQLLVIAIPLGAFEGVFLPASFSMLPEVLEDEDLQAGNALNSSSTQLAILLGSGIAGIVVSTLQSGAALALDALSFVVSAISLASMRGKRPPAPEASTSLNLVAEGITMVTEPVSTPSTDGSGDSLDAPEAVAEETKATGQAMTFWQLLRTSQFVQVGIAVVVVANLTFGGMLEVALPALARGPLAVGAGGFGLMLAAFGAGALIGGLGSGMLGNLSHRALIALLMGLLQSFAIVFIPYGGLIGAMVCMVVMGVCNSVSNVIFLTIMQQILPRHLLGRIMGVFMFASFGSFPLSVAVAGFVTARFGPVIIFPVSGAALFVAIVFGLSRRELREL